MADQKKPVPADFEKLLRELDLPRERPGREEKRAEYFNPWNMSKKSAAGTKRVYCNSLPDKFPE